MRLLNCTLVPYTTLFRSSHGYLRVRTHHRGVGAHPQWLRADLPRVTALRTGGGELSLVHGLAVVIGILGVWRVTHLLHAEEDRKSTRLNSSHLVNSYAVF